MSNILIFERPISNRIFRETVNLVHGPSRIIGISSFRGCSDIWSGQYLYDESFDFLDEELASQIDDIICRDRVTSTIDRDKAIRIVSRFWNGAKTLFEHEHFKYFYTLSVDCYEIDVLLRLSKRYGVRAISFIGSFLTGYAWITLRGERNDLGRSVTDEEVDKVVSALIDDAYLPRSETKNVKRAGRDAWAFYHRRMLIEHFYNPSQKLLKGDPDNEHYNQHYFGNLRFSDVYARGYDSYFSRIEDLSIDPDNTVYYPMHLIPEATTSYWCKDVARQGYESYVLAFIENADDGIHFLIKEHPAMMGKRRLGFYRELAALPNVDVIHPMDRSNELLSHVENVLVDNGTVGVEALARGKRVLAIEDNYYNALHPNSMRVSRVTREFLSTPLNEYDPYLFVADLLRGLFPSDYQNDKAQNDCSARQLASGVRLFLAISGEDAC